MKTKYLILAVGAAFAYWALKKQITAEKAVLAGSDYRSTGLYPNYSTTPQVEWGENAPRTDDGAIDGSKIIGFA